MAGLKLLVMLGQLYLFKIRSCYVAQTVLELLLLSQRQMTPHQISENALTNYLHLSYLLLVIFNVRYNGFNFLVFVIPLYVLSPVNYGRVSVFRGSTI